MRNPHILVHQARLPTSNGVVFSGTEVPVRTLFDALQRGRTVDNYLLEFPAVSRAQVEAVLQLASDILVLGARCA